MYSIARAGSINECWKEPDGLKAHTGLTPELMNKFILHSHKDIDDFIDNNRYIKHMGPVGTWSQENIDRLVLPTSGSMDVDEVETIDDIIAENDIIDDIENNV